MKRRRENNRNEEEEEEEKKAIEMRKRRRRREKQQKCGGGGSGGKKCGGGCIQFHYSPSRVEKTLSLGSMLGQCGSMWGRGLIPSLYWTTVVPAQSLRTVPTIVTAHIFCPFQGSRARRERNAQHAGLADRYCLRYKVWKVLVISYGKDASFFNR